MVDYKIKRLMSDITRFMISQISLGILPKGLLS